jgi:crossover junction endodeoxyribonuclease RusA
MTTTTTWHLPLPFTKPPLSLNDRGHWAAKARTTKAVRNAVAVVARSKKMPACERIAVELHYQQKVARPIDGDNLMATVKPCVDGLRDAGVVPDDDHTRVVHHNPVVHAPEPGQRHGLVWLVVRDLTEVT